MIRLIHLVALLVILASCTKEVVEDNMLRQEWNVQVIDAFDNPHQNIPVSIYTGIGCTYVFDTDTKSTDQNGKVAFNTEIDQDTLDSILAQEGYDDVVVFQDFNPEFDYDTHYIFDRYQNGEETYFSRHAYNEKDLITIRLIKSAKALITLETEYRDQVAYLIELDIIGQKGNTEINKTLQQYFFKSQPEITVTIPGSTSLATNYNLYTIENVDQNGSTSEVKTLIGTGSLNTIQIADGSTQSFSIQH